MDLHIGQYVKRIRSGSVFHEVESIVAGAAITQCGRRMEPADAAGRELEMRDSTPAPEERCSRC